MTSINAPDASITFPRGIDNSNIVGYYLDTSSKYHGFLYNGSTWTTIDNPMAYGNSATYIEGIEGNYLVGYHYDEFSNPHGFIYTIPEPATLLLLVFGGLLIRKRK
ncbi:PEP-CTERM sorting domain-containing protein [Candidatus Bathyarchaeota archaeon]|nr:PEP-CTERM sorting domain-containing protein [Candidatus Bathyarchaeota archaeon]